MGNRAVIARVVDGRLYRLEVDARTAMVDALPERLVLTSAKNHREGRHWMKPFHFERPTDASAATMRVANSSGAAFVAGGTNPVDLMKPEMMTLATENRAQISSPI